MPEPRIRLVVLFGGQDDGLGEGVAVGRVEVRATVIDTLGVIEERGLGCSLDIGVADEP